ncbi:MAG: PAS domain-containing sensor histidine kinase [Hyphomicrobium sp.]|nr:PAS domain-containing sensor histidine kinase [Hyphomicrobium sp.]
MSFDWRRWSGRSFSKFMTGWGNPPVRGVEPGAPPEAALPIPPAASGLIIALIFAGHYALTGDFLTAALLAACLAAALSAAALIKTHRATLAQLEASRDIHNLVADNAADLVTRHDAQGAITYASPAASALLGASPALLMRSGLSAAMSVGNAARCQDAISHCLELGAPTSAEVEISVGGAARWIEFRCKPLSDGESVVAVMRDITTRRWHAIAMRQAREEAESASRAKSAFIATISHELRTPLNAIIGFSEMLQRELGAEGGTARHADYSRIIRESGEHLMSLVKDLLDISKIEAGRLTICKEPFRLSDVIASSVDTLRPAVAAKSIALDVTIADDIGEMVADQRACKQMLMNLLSNACKFTPEGGRIELGALVDGGNVLLSVRDSGIGIAPDHVARLGEPFFQVDSSHSRQLEGAGLGLAIVRGLAELHGGRLRIESTLGEGSCFRLVLPMDSEMHDADPATEVERPQKDAAPAPAVAPARPIALVA